MTYDLALKLKEAGFPQEGKNDLAYIVLDNTPPWGLSNQRQFWEKVEHWYVPSLSELIEACGDKFGCLIYDESDKYWHVYSRECISDDTEWYSDYYINVRFSEPYAKGSTPEEAVANLWLKINAPR